jgi:dipeptidyl aminopeptidase/acylaminoacyl peptidase
VDRPNPSDLREHPRYREVWEYFRQAHEPALGRVRHAAELAPSPDGKQIIFCGSTLDKLEGTPQTRLGIVDERGDVHDFGTIHGSASSPAWSPDGSTLAYVSNRSQVVLNNAPFGRRVDGVVERLEWNPDSKRLLILTAGSGADASGAAGSGAISDNHAHASWMPYVEGPIPVDAWRRAIVVDVSRGETLWRTPDGENVWEATWCGNDAIAAVVSGDPTESSWYASQLVVYDTKSENRRAIHRAREEMGVPAASPNGRYVTIIEACCSDRTLVAGDVVLFDLRQETPKPQPVDTLGIDVTHVVWLDDDRLCFAGVQRMEIAAGEYSVAGGSSRETWRTSESVGTDFPWLWRANGSLFAIVDSYGKYQRIVTIEDGTERRIAPLDHPGTDFVARVGGRAEIVTWRGRDGLEIDGVLVLPEGPGPYPLIVNVHGGPVFSFRNDWSMHYYYVPAFARFGYAILNPNPRGSRGRGQTFARMVRGDMCGEDTFDILAGVDELIARGIADPNRIAVLGRSYGGYMASWLVTQTNRFAAAIPMAPVTDSFSHHFTANIAEFDRRFLDATPYDPKGKYWQRSPLFFARQASTPTLSMAGARDRCTPSGQALEFHRALAENGVPCELVIYPEEGHHVDRIEAQADQLTRMLLWLERFMPGQT